MKPDGDPTPPFENIFEEWIGPLASYFHDGDRSLYNYQQDLKAYNKKRGAPNQGPTRKEPIFGPDQLFYDDTTAWTAFWRILDPNDPVGFEDLCNSTTLGFCTVNM